MTAVYNNSNPTDQAMAALSVVEPGTGLVKAMAQSRPYGNNKAKGETTWNYNVEKSYGGGFGGFQNGSTMKAFTLAAAIQQGVPLNFRINSPKQINLSGVKFRTCTRPVSAPKYTPGNSTTSGNLTLLEATAYSTNTYFLQLSHKIGLCGPSTLATQLGVVNGKSENGLKLGEAIPVVPSWTLGIGSVTPLALANAYATFAARGKHCNPVIITAIKDKTGKNIPTPGGNCVQVMQEAHADGVNRVLQGVMQGKGTGARLSFGRPAAGKTGTTNNNLSVWYVGYTPNYAAAVAVADPDGIAQNLSSLTFNGRKLGRSVSGSGTAGPIWEEAMRTIHEGLPEAGFPAPDPKIVRGDVIALPRTTGMSPDEAINVLRAAGFNPEVAGERRNSDQPEGTVAYTDPRRSEGAVAGSTVIIYLSNGQAPKPPTVQPTGKPTVNPTVQPPKPPSTCPPGRPNCNR
jgi:membrane peptidoglycan carboxypeptidase